MGTREELKLAVSQLNHNSQHFNDLALEVFQYQYHHNAIYQKYVNSLKKTPIHINRIDKIPFLPIDFFKTHRVVSHTTAPVQIVFESSGTTQQQTSKHFVSDLAFYDLMSRKTFETMYSPLTDYHIFALLPSYLERNNSSLVYMIQNFILHSYSSFGGFYLEQLEQMVDKMLLAAKDDRKILLIGVTFALLDLVENQNLSDKLRQISHKLIVMETGGMKGRRKELIREELHHILCKGFGVHAINSEYGMTELLSQGYSVGEGWFRFPPYMKILLRETNDPFSYLPYFAVGKRPEGLKQKTGGINVIDLVNIDSCSFIETKDLGVFSTDYRQIQVTGRFDNADIRGCNLMVL